MVYKQTTLSRDISHYVIFLSNFIDIVNVPADKHVTRTFRFPEKSNDLLVEEAEALNQSVNSLINHLVSKYLYHGRFYNNTQLLSMDPSTISSLLMMLNDEEVAKAGMHAGSTRARDNLLMRGMKLDFPSVKWFIEEVMARYAGWFTCDYHQVNGVHMFHLRHVLDRKWSIFLQSYLDAMVMNILGFDVNADIGDDTVTLRIPDKSSR